MNGQPSSAAPKQKWRKKGKSKRRQQYDLGWIADHEHYTEKKRDIVSVIVLTFYFACWLGALVLLKYLLLTEYKIAFADFSVALVGALVLA